MNDALREAVEAIEAARREFRGWRWPAVFGKVTLRSEEDIGAKIGSLSEEEILSAAMYAEEVSYDAAEADIFADAALYYLQQGDVARASEMLGYAEQIEGHYVVAPAYGRARKITEAILRRGK